MPISQPKARSIISYMTESKTLAIIGLALNMAGVVLLFFFGFPQPQYEEEVGLAVEENTVFEDGTSVKDIKRKAKRKKNFYKVMSSIALLLIFVGFTLQLLSVLRTD